MISGLYGGISYSFKGRVHFITVFFMLTGAILGTQIGAAATKYVNNSIIKIQFGTAVLACMFSIILKQFGYKTSSNILIFITVFLLTAAIIYLFIKNKKKYGSFRKVRE